MTVLAVPDPENNERYVIPGGPVGEDETGLKPAAAVYLFEAEEDGETCVTMDMEYEIPRRRVDREKIREDAKFVGPVNVVVGPQGDYNWKVLVDLLGMDFRDVIDEVMDA
jgi:hypothetical protein